MLNVEFLTLNIQHALSGNARFQSCPADAVFLHNGFNIMQRIYRLGHSQLFIRPYRFTSLFFIKRKIIIQELNAFIQFVSIVIKNIKRLKALVKVQQLFLL